MDQNLGSNGDNNEELSSHVNALSGSCSGSSDAHTAAEFINSQLQLEAEAREALPYKFDNCTKPLGKLRQILFSCLTCNPIPANPSDTYRAAGICYSCSIQCHGNHTLVELFHKREFECDCGTTRLPATSPCNLRINPTTNERGGLHSEKPSVTNKYNQNFQNRFCGCQCDYDAETQKGTMFQCLGLGSLETGGCGEDWWHPGCIVGLKPDWYVSKHYKDTQSISNSSKDYISHSLMAHINELDENPGDVDSSARELPDHSEGIDPPLPPGFPSEDDFDGFICYKCVDANPWIKCYAGTPGFLPAVLRKNPALDHSILKTREGSKNNSKKRNNDCLEPQASDTPSKKVKGDIPNDDLTMWKVDDLAKLNTSCVELPSKCRLRDLPPPQQGQFSLFFKEDFRLYLCHCNTCYPSLQYLPQLLEVEDTYEPSVSTNFCEEPDSTTGSGSLYERGESVLKNIDRVRAIEGIMAYNHLKDKLKPFFQQFAESGKAISAEDIKAHFAKMRGDELNITAASEESQIDNYYHEESGY